MEDLDFSTSSATALIGNTYPSNPTDCSYLDLSSTTNIIPGGVLATKIQRTTLLKLLLMYIASIVVILEQVLKHRVVMSW
jgi:hypothetical protein